jgi:hypothetical protein
VTQAARIVVLTPVRNEAWILERFLEVTSRFADRIVLADQHSTDASRSIAARFPKVTVIDNPAVGFNEGDRQLLLLEAARRLEPGPRILLGLDADEVLAADAPGSPDWQRMLAAPPGTILGLERMDLLQDGLRVMRFPRWTQLGYVDDGAPHRPLLIHSTRVPAPDGAPELALPGVKVLHYALVRPSAVAAKARWYSALENCMGTCSNSFKRRMRYHNMMDDSRTARIEAVDPAWFAGWEAAGIPMRGDREEPFYWYDEEVLRLFGEHGSRRFWLDDLWGVDWEAIQREAVARGAADLAGIQIERPPVVLRGLLRLIDPPYRAQREWRARITPRHRRERKRRLLARAEG